MEGQSSGHSVAVCFHFSGVRPVGDGIMTSSVTLVAPAAHNIWLSNPHFVATNDFREATSSLEIFVKGKVEPRYSLVSKFDCL